MYPIGTLATATVRDIPDLRVLAATDGSTTGWISATPVYGFTFHTADQVTDLVPLAVVAATDDEIELVRAAAAGPVDVEALHAFADRLEASRAVPKPLEPTYRGSTLLDQDNAEWVRTHPTDPASWTQHESGQTGCTYAQIDAVAVLR